MRHGNATTEAAAAGLHRAAMGRWATHVVAWLFVGAAVLGCSSDDGPARGAPPENHDTTAAGTGSHRSAAGATPSPRGTAPRVHIVNSGTHGMAAVVRWLMSPDQRAFIVVEDPVGVEAESVPDGFLFASEETGAVIQVNDTWDVAPSPDWKRLAIGRAFIFRSGEADSIPAAEWTRMLRWLPEDVTERSTDAMLARAEGYVFPVSGMSYAKGIALTQVIDVGRAGPGRAAVVAGPTLRLEGWRVRWTPAGDTVAIGAAPRTVQDDAAPSRWTLVRARPVRSYRDSLGVVSPSRPLATPAWVVGPTIDITIPFDMAAERRVVAAGASVTSAGGRIRVSRNGAVVDVGPGAALAATRDGRFVAALRPNPRAGEFDHQTELVVYELEP